MSLGFSREFHVSMVFSLQVSELLVQANTAWTECAAHLLELLNYKVLGGCGVGIWVVVLK